MGIYGRVRKTIEAEAALPPGKRTQNVPCAFCTRGGNGDRSCSCGWEERAWNAVVVTIAVVALSLLCGLWCVCRERRIHERERCLRACPGGTAQRVVDRVNGEPAVRLCNRFADAVFGVK